jgi:TonB family protein
MLPVFLLAGSGTSVMARERAQTAGPDVSQDAPDDPPQGVQEGESQGKPEEPTLVPPVLRDFVHAVYPAEAMEEGISAQVVLLVEISDQGAVASVQVLQSAGEAFDAAAVQAVWQFRFDAATLDGQPIPVRIQYVYHFRLETREVKSEEGQVIQGTVKEKGVGLGVVSAEVALPELDVVATSDAAGGFELRQIPPGRYRLLVSAPQFRPLSTDVEVVEGRTLELALLLDPLEVDPYETVVIGEKQEPVVARYSLEQRTLETVPGTFGDPVRVVETLPGVARAPYGLGLLVIRGAAPNESKVFIDGVSIPLLYHFLAGPSVLNPRFLDRIDYYPGNFPTRYGNAMGGVIEVSTRTEPVEKWGGEADVNLLNAGAYLEGKPAEGMSLRLGARRSYVDGVIWAALKLAGEEGTSLAPSYYDYQAEYDYQLDARNRVGVFAFGSHDALKVVTTSEEQDLDVDLSTHTSFVRLVGSWLHARKGLSLAVRPNFGYDSFSIRSPGVYLEGDAFVAGGRWELGLEATPWLKVTTGMDGNFVHSRFVGEVPVFKDYYVPGSFVYGTGLDFLDVRKETLILNDAAAGAYVDLRFLVAKGLSITPGFRFDYLRYSGQNNVNPDPRLVLRYSPTDWLTLKGGIGRFGQEPNFAERTKEYGNPYVSPQWAMHYGSGFELKLGDVLSVDATGFYVRRYDLVIQSNDQTSRDGEIVTVRAKNQGEGHSYGMELIVKAQPFDLFYGWVAYTLSRTEQWGFEQFPGPGNYPVSPDERFLSSFDQTHILSAVASFRLGRGWETGARLRLVSGNPSTPVDEGIFLADSYSFSSVPGAFNSARLQTFFQLDVRVEKKWTFDVWSLTAYLDIQNVTNHANTEFIAYDYRFRKSWNVPGIPFFPSLGLTGRF